MEAYQIIMISIALAGLVAAPFIRSITTSIKEQTTDLQTYKLHVAEKYVTQDALKDHLERIEKGISELKTMVRDK